MILILFSQLSGTRNHFSGHLLVNDFNDDIEMHKKAKKFVTLYHERSFIICTKEWIVN